jgi:hypothetical protein
MHSPAELQSICNRCPSRRRPCKGACECLESGKDVAEHVESRLCPIGRYELGWGDKIAAALHLMGLRPILRRLFTDIARAGAVWLRDGAEPSCGCDKRQKALNSL